MATKTKTKSAHDAMVAQISQENAQRPTDNSGLRLAALAALFPEVSSLLGSLGTGAEAATGTGEAATGASEAADASKALKAGRAVGKAGKEVQGSKMGKAIAAHPIRSAAVPAALAAVGLNKASQIKAQKPKGKSSTSTPTPQTTDTPMIGSGIMPLFMQQVLGPYLSQLSQMNQQTAQNYGNYMNNYIGQANLNPAVRQALSAMVPGQQSMMNLLSQAGQQQAIGGSAMDQLSNQIQQAIQAQQAASGMYEKYMVPMLYGGSVSGVGGLPTAGLGVSSTPGTSLASQPGIGTNPVQQSLMAQQIMTGGG